VAQAPSKITALRSLLSARFPEKARKPGGGVRTGVPAVDEALGGGLPPGKLTELVSAAPSSGGQTILVRLLAATRAARQRVALVDAGDGFAPESVPADALRHLVWVRSRTLAAALSAADVLVRDGNYAVVAIDVRGVPAATLRRSPAAGWYRLQRTAECGTAAVLVQTPFELVPAVPWRLVLRSPRGLADAGLSQQVLASRLEIETVRGHGTAAEEGAG
jgi:hypothetical protein